MHRLSMPPISMPPLSQLLKRRMRRSRFVPRRVMRALSSLPAGSLHTPQELRLAANSFAFEQFCTAEPVLIGLFPAGDVLPGMTPTTILTSGPPLPFTEYVGGQRDAIIGAAQFEGLAASRDDAIAKLESGAISIAGAHDFGAVGSLAGVYTCSMPVFEVLNKANGNRGFCNFYEGTNPRRLNYGAYDLGVHERLLFVQNLVAPVLAAAIARCEGGIPLRPIMQRALHMGDELHSRNTAAALLFLREIAPPMLALATEAGHQQHEEKCRQTGGFSTAAVSQALDAITADHYFFLRLSMAAAKATADSARGVSHSSVVTAMCFSCKEFGIRVSGLGDEWFTGPHADVEAELFGDHTADEITFVHTIAHHGMHTSIAQVQTTVPQCDVHS
jgi:hypothetical protein